MIQVVCSSCEKQETLLLRHDDPDFDLKMDQWRQEHHLTNHTFDVFPLTLAILGLTLLIWVIILVVKG